MLLPSNVRVKTATLFILPISTLRVSKFLMHCGFFTFDPQSARNSVASVEGLYDRPRNRSSNTFNRSSLGEVLEEQFTASMTLTETPEPSTSLEFGVCAIRGFLYKRERFTWNKMNCLIRNSFLECHKPNSTQGPALKLFLPRSVITPDKEAKRQWAIRVKHPRREGVLQFAAENEEGYRKWMKAFSSAAAIEVFYVILYSMIVSSVCVVMV